MTVYPATYCPRCGTELGTKHVDGRDRQYCDSCDRVEWRNPAPGAGVAVVDPDRGVLLTKRDIEPGIGKWALPGGYLEVDETPSVGAARELEEETGVRVDPDDLQIVGTFTTTSFADEHVVSIRFVVGAERATGTPEAGPEVQAVEWFTPEEFEGSELHEPHDVEFERAWKLLGTDRAQ
ncbi:NUDIX domain-containing protein [Halorubellus sp. JP-L1]|uniref:NUDIX hydrolase n=1 Tax=Halorubellus sp. JP-L1 TaxID=2715753 RepID=UPI00140E0316|nr:NUDIX domain-containing protein [Halorubellus sp. JP-L1]NHN41917.1 NUDIX domain-containing protein [Halorubellus sp. JP-L1]